MTNAIQEFFTWDMLATLAGAALATGLVTGFVDKLFNADRRLPTQVIAYIVALFVLLLALYFTGDWSLSSAVLSMFNALVVASATSGTISAVKRMTGKEGK